MRVAAEVFAIRYVCGFGQNLPDGVVSFDGLFAADTLDPVPPFERERQAKAATQLAAITFDVSERGLVPVARNHYELGYQDLGADAGERGDRIGAAPQQRQGRHDHSPRNTPSIARMFSTMLGICTPMTASTSRPMRRSRSA